MVAAALEMAFVALTGTVVQVVVSVSVWVVRVRDDGKASKAMMAFGTK